MIGVVALRPAGSILDICDELLWPFEQDEEDNDNREKDTSGD